MRTIRSVAAIWKTPTASTSMVLLVMFATKSQALRQVHSASAAMEELLAIHSLDVSTAAQSPMEQDPLLAQSLACATVKLAILSIFGWGPAFAFLVNMPSLQLQHVKLVRRYLQS